MRPLNADISLSSDEMASADELNFSELHIQEAAKVDPSPGTVRMPPQQRTKKLFPGQGNIGRPCALETNHYALNVKVPEGVIYMYEVQCCDEYLVINFISILEPIWLP